MMRKLTAWGLVLVNVTGLFGGAIGLAEGVDSDAFGAAKQARLEAYFEEIRGGSVGTKMADIAVLFDTCESLSMLDPYLTDSNPHVRSYADSLLSTIGGTTTDEDIRAYVIRLRIQQISVVSVEAYLRPMRMLQGLEVRSNELPRDLRFVLRHNLEAWRDVRAAEGDQSAFRVPPEFLLKFVGELRLKGWETLLDEAEEDEKSVLSHWERERQFWKRTWWTCALVRARFGSKSDRATVLRFAKSIEGRPEFYRYGMLQDLSYTRQRESVQMILPHLYLDYRYEEEKSLDVPSAPLISEMAAFALAECLEGFPDYTTEGLEACRVWVEEHAKPRRWKFKD